ncbi:MAG: L-threonylcarbamoyladenylate synthase [Leptolyngbyaceae bacterium]|nr:L-threonylcarbamoyladenylate synthase [Leptolyngbyaceae bacterium]
MATIYLIHPDNPQPDRIAKVKNQLQKGAVMLYPTDTVYAIGCDLTEKSAVERVRQIKQLSSDKPLTFLCDSLSNISHYAQVSDTAYKIIKRLIPGPYTFILPATKLVPKLVMNPKRKTTGIRVPNHTLCQSLLEAVGNPIVSTSAPTPFTPQDTRVSQAELFDQFEKFVDIMIDDEQPVGYQVSTILDMTATSPEIVRRGLGWDMAMQWVDVGTQELSHEDWPN